MIKYQQLKSNYSLFKNILEKRNGNIMVYEDIQGWQEFILTKQQNQTGEEGFYKAVFYDTK